MAKKPAMGARQRQVLTMLADGLTNKEIAAQMQISTAGVKKHVEALMRRYRVGRRTAVVRAAIESGEILLGPRS